MCVISVCETTRPTSKQVTDMWDQNSHGGGAAWREEVKGEKVVRWRKGLTLEEMRECAEKLPFPFILHFRIASIGGIKGSLTHPFAVEDFDQSVDLAGKTTGTVIFHNGHWNEWHDALLKASWIKNTQIPRGPWSDSRAMAWLYYYSGQGFLDSLVHQKTVSFSPDKLELTAGDGWSKVGDIWFSNTYWERRYTPTTYGWTMCRFGSCTVKTGLDSDGRCVAHPKTSFPQNYGQAPLSTPVDAVAGRPAAGVAPPSDPFDPREQLLQAELAWSLFQAGAIPKDEAQACCSKQRLKRLRQTVAKSAAKSGRRVLTH